MSSLVSRVERNSVEYNKNPILKMYSLTIHKRQCIFFCHITKQEWFFIHEGILNPSVKNILNEKDIYLELIYDNSQLLSLSNEKRAYLISLDTFNNINSFQQYCEKNHIEIINNFNISLI